VTEPTTVTASFLPTPTAELPGTGEPSSETAVLTVARSGFGWVSAAPAGIWCGFTCSAAYAIGTAVTLTAFPSRFYLFQGWSGGGCSGSDSCTVTVAEATTVIAKFRRRWAPVPAPPRP